MAYFESVLTGSLDDFSPVFPPSMLSSAFLGPPEDRCRLHFRFLIAARAPLKKPKDCTLQIAFDMVTDGLIFPRTWYRHAGIGSTMTGGRRLSRVTTSARRLEIQI